MPLKILINGAGVAGPALATMLLRANAEHAVTIVERSPSLRTGGQQIDLRSHGIEVMKKLGLLDAVRERSVAEAGLAFVNTAGVRKAVLGVAAESRSFTSEYEIMRGDLVDVLVDASKAAAAQARGKGGLAYVFGKSATAMMPEGGEGVTVHFDDGSSDLFDLVVGADGQGSRTRRLAVGPEAAAAAFVPVGLFMAFFNIPRVATDDQIADVCNLAGGRKILLRSAVPSITQVYLGLRPADGDEEELMRASLRLPVARQKELWGSRFRNAGAWEARVLAGLDGTADFYAVEIGQVKMDSWSNGRVVLLGDAGYCPSPATGMGTTLSIVGAYVLAGELARHGDNVAAALDGYDKTLRPLVTEAQKLIPGLSTVLYPRSQWANDVLLLLVRLVAALRVVVELVVRLKPESQGGWKIPEYAEMKLEKVDT